MENDEAMVEVLHDLIMDNLVIEEIERRMMPGVVGTVPMAVLPCGSESTVFDID